MKAVVLHLSGILIAPLVPAEEQRRVGERRSDEEKTEGGTSRKPDEA